MSQVGEQSQQGTGFYRIQPDPSFHGAHAHAKWTVLPTKYICIKSTTVYVPSSELGLSHPPLLPASVPLPPEPKGGGAHSPAGKGLGESQFRRLEKSLALCLLCGVTKERRGGGEGRNTGISRYCNVYVYVHINICIQ
jgi:hypothetical protein